MVASRLTLTEFFHCVYLKHHIWLKSNTIGQYTVTLRLFDAWHGTAVAVENLSVDLILGFLRSRLQHSGSRTVNNKRAAILTLWRFAYRKGYCKTPVPDSQDIPKLPETKQLPTAWSIPEFSRLLDACSSARCLEDWDARTWRALLLVSFDTSHRLGALLSARRADLSSLGFLTIRGEHTKQGRDVSHKLHVDTIAALAELPEHRLLFPWPLSITSIRFYYKEILRVAGLPCGRRDLFHRLRRTSATHLAVVAGIAAAEQHLDHSTPGLAQKSYIDPRFLQTIIASDLMPRP